MKAIQVFLLLIGALTAVSCSTNVNLNAGENNYRIASATGGNLVEKYRLASKDGLGEIIVAEDSVALILKQAFLHDFSERLERAMAVIQTTTVRGEIAVVATAFEMQDGRNLDFSDVFAKKGGRLVYYSPDVRTGGHFLNFSAVPLYGPITYAGNPIAVKLVILELDGAESSQIKSVLATIANLGAKAYAPSSPVLGVLDAIGTELLSGEQDDLEFHYSFYLYPTGGNPGAPLPALRTGDYVFAKAAPTQIGPSASFQSTDWTKLCLDQYEGRLRVPVTANGDCKGAEFRDQTYMVINVQSGLPSVGLDTAEAFAGFEAKINEAAASKENLATFTTNLEKVIGDVKKTLLDNKEKDQRRRGISRTIELIQRVAALPQGRERTLEVLALNDALRLRPEFPVVAGGGGPEPYSDKEIQKLVVALRYSAVDPNKVVAEHVTTPATDALDALLRHAVPEPVAAP